MDPVDIDPADLRTCMLLAMDFIVAHRVSRDHRYDLARVTASRDLLEQRVLHALKETDETKMPKDWSWKRAAHTIAINVAMSIVEEDRESG